MAKDGREKTLWAEVKPEMMSDEERSQDSYILHPPSYRSEALNTFITKLDARLDKEKNTHPRLERIMGSPREKPVPSRFKKWTIKRELWNNSELEEHQQEEDAEEERVNIDNVSSSGSEVY